MERTSKKILIVDNDKIILTILIEKIENLDPNIEILTAKNYQEGLKIITENKDMIHAAIIDLNLPDALNGEMANYTLNKNIPTVVLTRVLKNNSLYNNVLDYIIKDGKKGINNAIRSINRILLNYDTTVLIVDDSITQKDLLKEILLDIKLNVITANNAEEALEIMKDDDIKISLVLIDHQISKKNGMELTLVLRDNYDKDELGIIGLSLNGNPEVSTEFIKLGANDFLEKPYSKTEVVIRVNSLLHVMQLFQESKELSYKDYLTGAYNRRYFFNSGTAIFEKAKRANKRIAIASIDIDNFKNINDTYGHDIGDICIIQMVKILKNNLRSSDLLARFGGEEFVILLENITLENTRILFEKIRDVFEKNKIKILNDTVNFRVSIGICYGMKENLIELLKTSDTALYYSKNNGKNQVKVFVE